MEKLEAKVVHGHTYYYYSKWARVDGKPRRLWQKYLGKLSDIAAAVEARPASSSAPFAADIFDWGLPQALWQECRSLHVASAVNSLCSTRANSLTTGDYLAIAALNRAISPRSKRSLWHWFSKTVLLRHFPLATEARLTSQRFWNHMDRLTPDLIQAIWHNLVQHLLKLDCFNLSSICYDGTNYYTFIDTFNSRSSLAQRGKNKQGRNDLRQISYALFCSTEDQIPLYFQVYEGNRNDAKQFPIVLRNFEQFLKSLTDQAVIGQTTLVFDKGNNSAENFVQLDEYQLHFVGSMKLSEHKELAAIPKDDKRFKACQSDRLEGAKAFRVEKDVYGKKRTIVVVYNQNLYNSQFQTLQNDIVKANLKLENLKEQLEKRMRGEVKKGRAPTVASIRQRSLKILSRQHLKKVLKIEVSEGTNGLPNLQYGVDVDGLQKIAKTYLGKSLVVTNRNEWTNEKIIEAYRSQFQIEDVFKASKDRLTGNWWPMHHWTDSKIQVHGLYCTIAQLLRALLMRRVKKEGIKLSPKQLLRELSEIREVINIYPKKAGVKEKAEGKATVLSRRSELQERLISALKLEHESINF